MGPAQQEGHEGEPAGAAGTNPLEELHEVRPAIGRHRVHLELIHAVPVRGGDVGMLALLDGQLRTVAPFLP